jgi:hypothetical protein
VRVAAGVGASVDDRDVAHPERLGDQGGIQRDTGAEARPGIERSEDQHRRVGVAAQQLRQVRGDVTVGVADVVGDAGRGDRLDAVGERHQHGVGVGNRQLVGQGSTPVAACQAEAVHRDRRNVGAVGGVSGAAGRAAAAVDLEGNHHALARVDGRHVLADGQHLGDALVAELERQRERAGAKGDEGVHVAGGDRDRTDHRTAGCGRRWGGHAVPRKSPTGAGHQGAHAPTSRPDALTEAIPASVGQTTQTLPAVALQPQPRRRDAGGGQQPRVVAHPPVWSGWSRPAPTRARRTPREDAHPATADVVCTNSRTEGANAAGWTRMIGMSELDQPPIRGRSASRRPCSGCCTRSSGVQPTSAGRSKDRSGWQTSPPTRLRDRAAPGRIGRRCASRETVGDHAAVVALRVSDHGFTDRPVHGDAPQHEQHRTVAAGVLVDPSAASATVRRWCRPGGHGAGYPDATCVVVSPAGPRWTAPGPGRG